MNYRLENDTVTSDHTIVITAPNGTVTRRPACLPVVLLLPGGHTITVAVLDEPCTAPAPQLAIVEVR